jgi:Rod binding domain-containing protein
MIAENLTHPENVVNLPPITMPIQTRDQQLMAKAQELEATFLSEMLANAGLGEMSGPFGGGQGEAQFASFLRQEQSKLIVKNGGLGLAEMIFRTMAKAENDRT